MANYLLKPHRAEHVHGAGRADPSTPRASLLVRFQRGFERRFEKVREGYLSLLHLALERRVWVVLGFVGVTALSLALTPFLGRDFFPALNSDAIKIHVRAQTGTRIEETTALCDAIEGAVRAIIPPSRLEGIVDNIGMPISGTNISYGNSGTIGVEDADIMVSLKRGKTPAASYVKTLREKLPRAFPGATFSFLPADIVSQILNFGAPAPLDVQIVGDDLGATRNFANALLEKIRRVPGIADPRIEEAFEVARVARRFSSLAGGRRRND